MNQDSKSFEQITKKAEQEGLSNQIQSGCYTKIQPIFAKIFSLDVSLLPQVGKLKLALIYIMLFQTLHIVLLFAVFSQTNATLYLYVSAIISALQIIVYFIIRFSTKFMVLKAVGSLTVLFILGEFGTSITFIMNLVRFQYFCDIVSTYYNNNQNYPRKIQQMCHEIQRYYYSGQILSVLLIISRVIAVAFILKAYKVTKQQFDQNEMKKRRKDKYNQLLLKKHGYNKDRQL